MAKPSTILRSALREAKYTKVGVQHLGFGGEDQTTTLGINGLR